MTSGPLRIVALAAMSLLYFLLMAGTFNALGVLLPRMVPALGMNWTQAGFGFTLLGLSCGLASLLPAITIRHIGIRATLFLGGLVLAAGFACLADAHSVTVYQAGTTLLGLGFCFCGTVPGVHVISGLFERRASTALGAYFTIGGLGSVFGPLLFSAIDAVTGDWRLFWTGFAVAAVVLGCFAAAVTGRGRPAVAMAADDVPAAAGWHAGAAFRAPQFWVVVAAYTGCLLVNTTMHSFAVQHLTEHGLALGQAAGLISVAALIGAAASAVAGLLGERIAPRWLTVIALAALALAAAMLALPQGTATLALFAWGIGLGLGISYVGTAMLLLDWFGRRPNLELYSVMCVVSTAAAAGPVLGGMVRDESGSFVAVFATLAGVALAILALLVLTPRPAAHG
jgi:MFS family permease